MFLKKRKIVSLCKLSGGQKQIFIETIQKDPNTDYQIAQKQKRFGAKQTSKSINCTV